MSLVSSALRRVAGPGALALALVITSVTPAMAQDEQVDLSFLGEGGYAALAGSLAAVPVSSTAGVIGSVGSADFPIVSGSTETVGTPSKVDPTIQTTKFLGVERYDGPDNVYEYWSIQSAAMQRVITVEVVKARGQEPAPVLYMLDGVGAPLHSTGWNHVAGIHELMADENVHIVNPAGAFASFYSDWEKEDPVLGNHRWETFLTEELPPIIAAKLNINGRAGIVGNSMGAQAAMHLAANHPDVYDAVMAYSGNYSTTDERGYQTVRLSVETRGGDIRNMWGPRGSERWQYHDTISHPEKLRGTAVYLSSGTGVIGPEDPGEYGGRQDSMLFGIVLERGALEATRAFEQALNRAGVEHRVDYLDTGLHNWATFMKNFENGWEYIKPALQD